MKEENVELLVKRSRTLALLCALILILLVTAFFMSYFDIPKEEQQPAYCGVLSTPNVYIDNARRYPDGAKLFKQNCAVCHSAHTDQLLTGPGLLGIEERLPAPPKDWFIAYVLNNEKVKHSGDPYSKKLRAIYKEDMTVFEGSLKRSEVEAIYDFLTEPQSVVY